MPRYRVPGTMTISVFVDVEAASPEEAREKAHEHGVPSLCWSCARGEPDRWRTSGELDGEPEVSEDIDDVLELEGDE